jgi:hypothetical protein
MRIRPRPEPASCDHKGSIDRRTRFSLSDHVPIVANQSPDRAREIVWAEDRRSRMVGVGTFGVLIGSPTMGGVR